MHAPMGSLSLLLIIHSSGKNMRIRLLLERKFMLPWDLEEESTKWALKYSYKRTKKTKVLNIKRLTSSKMTYYKGPIM